MNIKENESAKNFIPFFVFFPYFFAFMSLFWSFIRHALYYTQKIIVIQIKNNIFSLQS